MINANSIKRVPEGMYHWYLLPLFICVFGHVMLGEWFYKTNISGVYLTELFLLVLWAAYVSVVLIRWKIKKTFFIFPLLILSLVYLVYSLIQQREIEWVVRQAVFILYASVAIWGYLYCVWADKKQCISPWVFNVLGVIGLVGFVFHSLFKFVPGHPAFSSLLLLLVGVSYWLVRSRHPFIVFALGLFFIIFSFLISNHTSWIGVFVIILGMTVFVKYKETRLLITVVGSVVIVLAFLLLDGLSDPNAVWRFLYWKSVILESWNNSYFLLGQGYGVSFFPEMSDDFERLISQVSQDKPEYQLYTVPPHNGLLTILIYLGIPGVLLVLAPIFIAIIDLIKSRMDLDYQVLFIINVTLFALLSSNQFIEVPYTAVFFWWFYGALLYKVKSTRKLIIRKYQIEQV